VAKKILKPTMQGQRGGRMMIVTMMIIKASKPSRCDASSEKLVEREINQETSSGT
jgi:hypothetical protein